MVRGFLSRGCESIMLILEQNNNGMGDESLGAFSASCDISRRHGAFENRLGGFLLTLMMVAWHERSGLG